VFSLLRADKKNMKTPGKRQARESNNWISFNGLVNDSPLARQRLFEEKLERIRERSMHPSREVDQKSAHAPARGIHEARRAASRT